MAEKFKIDEQRVKHIFRAAEGHLSNDTVANRQLLEDAANNPDNYVGTDSNGNLWFVEITVKGQQIWVRVRGDTIVNGGVNISPKTYNPATGLDDPPRK
jgi:hypothetical protein